MAETNITTSGQIDDLTSIAIAEALLGFNEGNVPDLARFFAQRNPAPGEGSVRFPKYGTYSATATTEGQEVARTQLGTDGVLLTPDTNATFRVTLSDKGKFVAPQIVADAGQIAGATIRDKRNADAWALFAGISGSVGASNRAITEDDLMEAGRQIRAAGGVGQLYVALETLGEKQIKALYSTNGNLTSDQIRNAVVANGVLPPIHGIIPIIVPTISSSGTITGCVFDKRAFGYAEMWFLNAEVERRAALIGQEMVWSSCYAVGEVKDEWARRIVYQGDAVVS